LQRGRIGCKGISSNVLHDPRIIGMLGEKKKRSNRSMEAHKQGEEREENLKDVPMPGSRGYGMAR
jgi:hypothetical protein